MSPWLVAPLLVVAAGLAGAICAARIGTPAASVRLLTAVVVVATVGVAAALALVALAGASELAVVADIIGWCRALAPGDHGAAPWAGLLAALALSFACRSAIRHVERFRKEVTAHEVLADVTIVSTPGVVAHAVPGRRGGVVLGEGLIAELDAGEQAIVLAHERAHLRYHHHRYVLTAETCAAALPVLRPLARRIRFHTERWADEAAANEVGARAPVARTIAKVALLQPTVLRGALAFGASGTVERVEALLAAPRTGSRVLLLLFTAALLVTVSGTAAQLHHVAGFVAHACGV